MSGGVVATQRVGRGHRGKPIVDGRRECTRCGVTKPLTEFHRDNHSPYGVASRCKSCIMEAKRPFFRHQLLRKYGITVSEYKARMATQGGRCAICGNESDRGALRVDHDHETGNLRGLLCHNCNVGLGHFLDNPDLLDEAAAYLRSYNLPA